MTTPRYDVSILNTTSAGTIVSSGDGERIYGVKKLVQRVILELLTVKGSMTFNPEVGCTFLSNLKKKPIYSEFDVKNIFLAAKIDIINRLKQEEDTNTPDDERLENMSLTTITLVPGRLLLTIAIKNKAGTKDSLTISTGVTT